ncbi:MAG: 50S ribosomal protein L24 [Lachnospiraceae bacterium]|jgi:large subunit ribosomal protein L24|nr:50S ribosomal protein L24 [Lachnospiraceae bacterium]MCI1726387.1 50S ribosomal protein L24 [Lachnospiraceae bacterium]
MPSLKIKKDDMVRVIAGKDKDKEGKVLSVNVKDSTIVVEGVNMITKHQKPSQQNQQGGIVNKEAPIHISNVMYLHKGKPTRIGFRVEGEGDKKTKVRIAKKTGEKID